MRKNENTERRIADKSYNIHLREASIHKSTQIAPSSLLQEFPSSLKQDIESRQEEIEGILTELIGKPTYYDSGFILYCEDCLNVLPRLENSNLYIDLTITSPPYNIGKEYETKMSIEDYIKWCSKWMTQIYKITKSQGAFWLNLGYLEVENEGLCVPIPYLVWNKSPFYLLQEVVWKYGAGVSTKRRLTPRNEKWLFYVKDESEYTFNLDDVRDPNVKYPNQMKKGKFRCHPLGKNPSDVWEYPKVTTGEKRSSQERTSHPAQFPLKIVERIIRASSNQVDLVLDPFAGSCSAGLAAAGLGRIFLGIEINPEYCELSINRYKRFQKEREELLSQGKLF